MMTTQVQRELKLKLKELEQFIKTVYCAVDANDLKGIGNLVFEPYGSIEDQTIGKLRRIAKRGLSVNEK